MSFDPRCFDLAQDFLPNDSTRESIAELAQLIQVTIEDHLNYGVVAGAHPPSVAGDDSRTRPDLEVIDGIPHVTVITGEPEVKVVK